MNNSINAASGGTTWRTASRVMGCATARNSALRRLNASSNRSCSVLSCASSARRGREGAGHPARARVRCHHPRFRCLRRCSDERPKPAARPRAWHRVRRERQRADAGAGGGAGHRAPPLRRRATRDDVRRWHLLADIRPLRSNARPPGRQCEEGTRLLRRPPLAPLFGCRAARGLGGPGPRGPGSCGCGLRTQFVPRLREQSTGLGE